MSGPSAGPADPAPSPRALRVRQAFLGIAALLALAGGLALLPRWIAPGPAAPSSLEAVVTPGPATLHDLDGGPTLAIGALPWRRQLEPRGFRSFRLEMPFDVRDRHAAEAWGAYFLTLNDGGRVSVNGVLVGDVTSSNDQTAVSHVRPFLFTFSPALLRDGTNRLTLEWSTHDSLQHLSAVHVGPLDVLRPAHDRRLFWQNSMAHVGFDFALVSAAILLGIGAMRRSERGYVLMGLTSLGWADVCLAYFVPPMPAGWLPAWHLLRICGIAVAACCTWLFVLHETGAPHRRMHWLCIGWAFAGPLGYALNFALTGSIFSGAFEGAWGAGLLMLGAIPLTWLGRELAARWQWRRGVIWLAVAAGLAAGLADIALLATGSGVLGGIGYSAPAVSPIWFMAIVLVLVKDFADSIARQQQQNRLMAERLQAQQQELQRLHLAEQQLERERAAEEERQRIMQDMHDGLGSQLLSSLALVERGELDGAQTSALLRECIDDLRLAIDSLASRDDGFAVMVGNLRFRMEPRLRAAGIALRWNSRDLGHDVAVPPTRSLPVLRILQEAMGNALRHAQARTIEVALRTSSDGWLEIEVRDDGRGFDARQVRRGKGLAGIEKRVRALDGSYAVESDEAGTRLSARVPLPPPDIQR